MKQSNLLILLLTLSIISCTQHPTAYEKAQAANKKQNIANEIRQKVASRLKKELDLDPSGTMGQMLNEIEKLGLSFCYYQPIEIAEGRKLLVKAVDSMLEEINKEPRVQPYLVRQPFIPRNIEIEIFLRNPDGNFVSEGALNIIEAVDGIFRYKIHHPTEHGFITVYQETYEEAVARIADPSLPPVPSKLKKTATEKEWEKVREGVSFIGNDGAIWKLDEKGNWVKQPK